MSMSLRILVVAAAALGATAVSGTAHAQEPDAFVGTWQLSIERSTLPPGTRGGTRIVQELADGTLYVTQELTGAEGQGTAFRALLRRDGRDYRLAMRRAAGHVTSLAYRYLSRTPLVIETVRKINGVSIATATEELSPDGQTCTVTTQLKERDGSTRTVIEVWERRESR
jgi:hypothetical protein